MELQGQFDGSRTVNLEESGLKHESSFQTYAIKRNKILFFPHLRRTKGNELNMQDDLRLQFKE